ncbi:hypothetical protein LR48_Vigan08g116000 [Vigna angularis]|uniref:Phosphoenolpyruvate carboxylase n=1 Tax=Phaseolus angularis TaxID=3914 RepID=A0A0L9V5R8_PHAAN|nr:hypothetical protein LR48_Vigan08g116000 [Vigna angularis]
MSLSFVDEAITFIVQEVYKISAEYEGKRDPKKLEELGNMITSLDAGDSIVVAMSFSHMLNLANLAEEVQISRPRRNKVKKGDFADENNATTDSNIEETLKKLVFGLKKSPREVFDALKNQTVDLVLTTHPTQSIRECREVQGRGEEDQQRAGQWREGLEFSVQKRARGLDSKGAGTVKNSTVQRWKDMVEQCTYQILFSLL